MGFVKHFLRRRQTFQKTDRKRRSRAPKKKRAGFSARAPLSKLVICCRRRLQNICKVAQPTIDVAQLFQRGIWKILATRIEGVRGHASARYCVQDKFLSDE